jgi:hypothetical protein
MIGVDLLRSDGSGRGDCSDGCMILASGALGGLHFHETTPVWSYLNRLISDGHDTKSSLSARVLYGELS